MGPLKNRSFLVEVVALPVHDSQLISFCLLSVCSGCLSSKAEDRLFRKLFRRYNQFIRPVENVSDPVTVEFEVSISQLVKVVRLATHAHVITGFSHM